MILYTMFALIILLIAAALILITSSLALRSVQDRDKSSPFECGFDPKKSARIPFSLRFFLLTILFLVFDIEVVLILPLPTILTTAASSLSSNTINTFLIILVLGLLHEWNEGSLEWTS